MSNDPRRRIIKENKEPMEVVGKTAILHERPVPKKKQPVKGKEAVADSKIARFIPAIAEASQALGVVPAHRGNNPYNLWPVTRCACKSTNVHDKTSKVGPVAGAIPSNAELFGRRRPDGTLYQYQGNPYKCETPQRQPLAWILNDIQSGKYEIVNSGMIKETGRLQFRLKETPKEYQHAKDLIFSLNLRRGATALDTEAVAASLSSDISRTKAPAWWDPAFGDYKEAIKQHYPVQSSANLAEAQKNNFQDVMVYAVEVTTKKEEKESKEKIPMTGDIDLLWNAIDLDSPVNGILKKLIPDLDDIQRVGKSPIGKVYRDELAHEISMLPKYIEQLEAAKKLNAKDAVAIDRLINNFKMIQQTFLNPEGMDRLTQMLGMLGPITKRDFFFNCIVNIKLFHDEPTALYLLQHSGEVQNDGYLTNIDDEAVLLPRVPADAKVAADQSYIDEVVEVNSDTQLLSTVQNPDYLKNCLLQINPRWLVPEDSKTSDYRTKSDEWAALVAKQIDLRQDIRLEILLNFREYIENSGNMPERKNQMSGILLNKFDQELNKLVKNLDACVTKGDSRKTKIILYELDKLLEIGKKMCDKNYVDAPKLQGKIDAAKKLIGTTASKMRDKFNVDTEPTVASLLKNVDQGLKQFAEQEVKVKLNLNRRIGR